jgi:hypothetical protein
MHGGSIVLKSEGHGKGAEFVVALPLAEDEPAVQTLTQQSERGEHDGSLSPNWT